MAKTPPRELDYRQRVIDLGKVDPSPYQLRKHFDEDTLRELAASIQREGLIEPINGTPSGDVFLAVDTLGAGLSDVVAVTTGVTATNAVSNKDLPIDAAIIAILEHVSIDKKEILSKDKED